MSHYILFLVQFLLVAVLSVFHFFYAVPNEWYWHYLWLDVPMHFLGGLWAALFVTWLLRAIGKSASFVAVFVGVIIIGILWEVYEYALHIAQPEANYPLDTALDLLMDSLGGVIGIFAAQSRRRDTIDSNAEIQNDPS